nr:DID [Drosophila melanogaster]
MATSVLLACGLNEQKLPGFVHISEESNVDGSFLISCVLGQRLRISNAGTLLVCLQHHYQHYFNAGMRLGYNTNIFQGKTLGVIDVLSDMAGEGLASKWLTNTEGQTLTEQLVEDIRAQVESNYANRNSYTVLIDNLSILFNLGASKLQVQQFCQDLAALGKEREKLTVITKLSNSDIYQLTDNNVAKLGQVRIQVLRLKSGVFREVDGKLLIERVLDEGNYACEETRKEVLYKVNDRNVKVFAPGEIGVKV